VLFSEYSLLTTVAILSDYLQTGRYCPAAFGMNCAINIRFWQIAARRERTVRCERGADIATHRALLNKSDLDKSSPHR